MAMTEAEKQELKQAVLDAIKADSQGVDELETISTLDNVNSLPAMQGEKVVKAPISLLAKPATDAATTANTAAENAQQKATLASASAASAASAATDATNAAQEANKAVNDFATLKNEFEMAMGVIPTYYKVITDDNLDTITAPGCYCYSYVYNGKSRSYGLLVVTKRTGYIGVNGTFVKVRQYNYNNEGLTTRIGTTATGDIVWEEWAESKGSGSGNGFFNVTEELPLDSGYYTKSTAVTALEYAKIDDEQKRGMIITFESKAGKWEDWRFVGTNISTFFEEASWERFGGGDAVKSLFVNGVEAPKDETGRIDIAIDRIEVDDSLDSASTNPISNGAVTSKIMEVEANTVFGANAELSDDESSVRLSLTNKSGAEIVSVDLPAGSGGSGEDTQTTKIVLMAEVDNNIIKEGDNCVLTYSYDHQNVGGDDSGTSTGQKAKIEITLKRGANVIFSKTDENISKGTYPLDITKYLSAGTTDIYVKATVIDPNTGKTQSKQSYASVKAVTLTLSSSYNLAQSITAGGYDNSSVVAIPFTVSGSGTKNVALYFDGAQIDIKTITKSGTTNGSFSVSMSGKSVGRHNLQMVSEMEASAELTLRSESIYIDILKKGSSEPFIGTMYRRKDGAILVGEAWKTARIESVQYEQMTLDYVAYNEKETPTTVDVYRSGVKGDTLSVPRTIRTYNNRFTEKGEINMAMVCGDTTYNFIVEVQSSGIEVSEAEYGLLLKLDAAGRSNEESEPGKWVSGKIETTFDGFDWKTSGWTGESLKLINGAKIVIGATPFVTDAATNGYTIEMEFKVSNVRDRSLNVASCYSGNKGFVITGDKASMYTGSTKNVVDEDGNETIEPIGVSRQYGEDMWIKTAFVIGKRADGRKIELYVNGTRSAADIYSEGDNFKQDSPVGISINSDGADVEVRNIRLYERALSDDEEVDNNIVDAQSVEMMVKLFESNNVLNDEGTGIDFEKLREKGKSLMLIVRPNGITPINAENNKKTDFLSDVYLWMPDGRYIYMHNVYIRIQGTSSTKYPSKNYRIYAAKGESPELWIDGVLQESNKFALRIGQKPVKIFCPKADYSDSSMVQNTGGSQIFNRMMKSLGFLTPPQEHDETIRIGVDGFPIDIFSAETIEETPTYAGQYNFNHDKSDWYDIIGMQNVDGFEPSCPIAFEFLNNTEPLCLFQVESDLDAQALSQFDNALEFNYPKDVTWATSTEEQKNAFKILWEWIRDCVPAGADTNKIDSFVSVKFKSEVEQHINLNFLLCWYLFTDYQGMVDQRVKNMIWLTFNGKIWFLIYYDGDTQIGDRNDSFLKYLYDMSRDTWDDEKSKYAFEGHDSYLWCLLLANMKDEIKAMATKMRSVLTEELVNKVFDEEQQSNWCSRAYNKSGEIKYIKPQTEGVLVGTETVKYPYIYALKGDKQSFRHWFIKNRYALLDAKYETGNYLSDNIDMYMSRSATDAANSISVTSNELYYFGYGTNNAPHLQESKEAKKGEIIKLVFTKAFTVNDPLRIYGASRMQALDMRGAANNITGDINLNKCNVLRKLDISTTGAGSNGWCMVLDQCKQIEEINLKGQKSARTGTLSSSELNFNKQTKLKTLDATGVIVDGVVFAEGAPLTSVKLSNSIKTLKLEYLPLLKADGLSIAGFSQIETFRFAACPYLDCWDLLTKCVNVKQIRIEGVNLEGDGALLEKYIETGGIDADGNATDTCALVGNYKLTKFLSDNEYNRYKAHYPELNIVQPEYTKIEFDDSVADDANISNLDNATGYKYGNTYVASGHITKILAKRHRVLAKMTKKATTYGVNIAGVDTTMNNLDGEMSYYPLNDSNSKYYEDGTEAKLDGTEGDWMMYEPFFWSKGINDILNSKKYSCYCSNDEKNKPSSPSAFVMTLEDIKNTIGGVTTGKKIMAGKDSIANSYSNDSTYSVCKVSVKGYKKVRFPSVPGTNLIGSVFTDKDGVILKSIVIPTLNGKFEAGMYVISDIPTEAENLYFTILNTAEFDKVVLSNSDKIEDMETDWVANDEHLCAIVGSSIVGSKLRSCITGGSTAANMTWTDFHFYSAQRGMQQIDALMHSRIANLSYAKYGRRDMQEQCGAGQHTNMRTTGGTALYGMTDTIGYEEAKTIKESITNSLIDNLVHQYAWYKTKDDYGSDTVSQVNNICCLGYEDIYGHKYDMMDNVDLPNTSGNAGKWRIWMPDGSTRFVKGTTTSDYWITAVAHGKYMDVVSVGTVNGSSSTYYSDKYYISTASSRVVYRGFSYAHVCGGVSNANAFYDASYAHSYVGSRLAFRGKIVKASSVSAYKSIIEVA